jgi:ABC-2 type transport system permease protein
MLWYKAWLETRVRFFFGLGVLVCFAVVVVLVYPRVMREVLPLAATVDPEGASLLGSYRGYVWSQWFRENVVEVWTYLAVLLGTGGLLIQASSGGGALYTLSMPVTRTRLLGVRAAAGLAELFLMAVIPALMFPLLSPLVGQTYGIGEALVYATCLFVAGSVFYSVAFLMSTIFRDVWRPLVVAICAAFGVGFLSRTFHDSLPSSLLVITGESYFRGEGLPWSGLLIRIAASAALLYGALRNIERQDF